jgi:HlyD family secretion protein
VAEKILARLLAGTRGEDIQKIKAEVAAARTEAENAQNTLKRYEALAQTETISKQEVDNVRTTAAVAAERLRSAENSLTLAVKGPRIEDIEEARAQLSAAKAQLATAEKSLSEAKLYAPDNGVIMNRILEPGDLASPQIPVVTLALSDPVWVRAYVVETDLGRIREGMEAQITTDSHPDKTYVGWVGFISPTAEFTPKSVETAELRSQLVYQVRIMVKNPTGELRLGMPATVTIPLKP